MGASISVLLSELDLSTRNSPKMVSKNSLSLSSVNPWYIIMENPSQEIHENSWVSSKRKEKNEKIKTPFYSYFSFSKHFYIDDENLNINTVQIVIKKRQ